MNDNTTLDPNKFSRESFYEQREVLASTPDGGKVDNPSRRFLLDIAKSAKDASTLVQEAWANAIAGTSGITRVTKFDPSRLSKKDATSR